MWMRPARRTATIGRRRLPDAILCKLTLNARGVQRRQVPRQLRHRHAGDRGGTDLLDNPGRFGGCRLVSQLALGPLKAPSSRPVVPPKVHGFTPNRFSTRRSSPTSTTISDMTVGSSLSVQQRRNRGLQLRIRASVPAIPVI